MNVTRLYYTEGNERLILIFGGWSSSPEMYSMMTRDGWDTIVCLGYDNLDFNPEILEGYNTVYLYGWSMGVAAAERIIPQERVTRAFAINGTAYPRHDTEGIPAAVYDATTAALDSRTLEKFRIRMCGGVRNYNAAKSFFQDSDDIGVLRSQLETMGSLIPIDNFRWDRAYISDKDLIIPTENQLRHWNRRGTEICMSNGSHLPDFESILESSLPSRSNISRQFKNSRTTYDRNAIAQHKIASTLRNMLAGKSPKHAEILEIGCGTGLYTSKYIDLLEPSSLTLVDLSPEVAFPDNHDAEIIEADAEKWIAETTRQWDIITSASTIQWFADLKKFLLHCHRCLRKDGILALSGFTKGNLSEFDHIRPNPIIYPDMDKIKTFLTELFENVEVTEDIITVEFDSKREALLHLKNTGVSGTHKSSSNSGISNLSAAIPVNKNGKTYLTYRPIYILCRKPLK